MTVMKKIKLAIVDDHKLFRRGLISILQQNENLEVVFDSGNGKEFLNHPQFSEIEVVL